MGIALIAFLVFLIVGMPIPFVLGSTGLVHMFTVNPDMLFVMPQRIFAGINNSGLSAIPYFIIAGELMGESGVSQRLLQLVRDLIGWIRGGLGYATIVIAGVLSAVLGSPNAVSSILCKTMIPDMKKDGYSEEFTGSLIAACGVLDILPPSSVLVIYSVIASTSIMKMYYAAVIPSFLLAIGYAVLVFIFARKNKYGVDAETNKSLYTFNARHALKSLWGAIPALMVPGIMIGGTMSGVFTPTEAGAISCVAAVAAGLFYRALDVRKIPQMLGRAAGTAAVILFIIAMGNILAYSMAIDHIPQLVSDTLLNISDNPNVIILLMLAVMVVVGCLMEATAGLLIFAPVLIPVATAIGLNEIHFGLVFSLMMTVALITPPVGMLLFVTSNVAGINLTKLFKSIWPFALVALLITMALAYLPDLVMYLPNLMTK
ncbi:MAG: TRAP transporter large permease [Clostridia bacterium]|jgi:tripartite ATP-independent transporter DctM subunit|nr:TRAP transporter large permease [Clostridia bacterium]